MNYNITQLVKKALYNYDIKNEQYKDIISQSKIDRDRNEIILKFKNKNFNYNILGLFDNTTNIWMWGWMSPIYKNKEIEFSKKLLDYGIKINIDSINQNTLDKLYLKTQFTNSRFLLNNKMQLDLHLAISLYLLKDNFDFIYSDIIYMNKEKTKYLIVYYLLKNI